MAEHDAPLMLADYLRSNGNSHFAFSEAIKHYEYYLELGGSRRSYAYQMIGVCYQRLHRYSDAIVAYMYATDNATDYELGNIERDLAESYGAINEFDLAATSLANSLQLLPADQYPQEHAAALGFYGRLEARQGNFSAASLVHHVADVLLERGQSRHDELYNKLSYASALDGAEHSLAARTTAFKALRLSLRRDSATGDRYGSRAHHVRALALIVGGIALERTLAASSSRT